MSSPSTLVRRLPGLINGHIHGTYGPQFRGIKGSSPFELSGINLMAREDHPPTASEYGACALVTGLENLLFGNTAVIDHYYGPLTAEHVYAVASAYEDVGVRAWVLLELTDLPWLCYTKEAYPKVANAVARDDLSEELDSLVARQPRATCRDIDRAVGLLRGWTGNRVRIGLALGNPVWCSDDLIAAVAAAARDLAVPITAHVEESPLQRRISLEQWGLTSVERMERCGALSDRTILSHAVHIDGRDMDILARHGASICHNPISNLKLQVGIAPVGEWVRRKINVCLGSDGQSSGDSQNLFAVMKFVAALADLNGLRSLAQAPEELALAMATSNGARFWGADDLSGDTVEFEEPLGACAHVWDDPTHYIAEVYVGGRPRLATARAVVAERKAKETVLELRARAAAPAQAERADRLTGIAAGVFRHSIERVEPLFEGITGDEQPSRHLTEPKSVERGAP